VEPGGDGQAVFDNRPPIQGLAANPVGAVVLALMGMGFVAYGVRSVLEARFRGLEAH
jgi:hypothetical protein